MLAFWEKSNYLFTLLQILTKRLKHLNDKYKNLQVDYDELKMISEKVRITKKSVL